jgi:chaperonin GroEL
MHATRAAVEEGILPGGGVALLRLISGTQNWFLTFKMELSEQSGIGTSFNGVLMPIRGFLTGQAFEPEVVRQMSLALETICGKLPPPPPGP